MQQQCPDAEFKKRLVGQANEATAVVEGVTCPVLLDTGSTVSTISKQFYEAKLKDNIPLHPMEEIIKI